MGHKAALAAFWAIVESVDRLHAWGLDDQIATALSPGSRPGRVVQVDRGECDVITAAGLVRAGSDSVRAQSETAPVTGDWVELADTAGETLIDRVLERRSALTRRDSSSGHGEQVLAANFDVVGIVAGIDRALPPGRFERLLVMARDSGAAIVVLLTKADRAADGGAGAAAAVRAIVGTVPTLLLSVNDRTGLDELAAHLGAGRTLALVGASGSGKSSLLNALAGAEVAAIGEVRPSDRRGRHTTIARRLELLPDDAGLVIDTPGIRALGITDAEDALMRVFDDIVRYAQRCRFADCAHAVEPDCEVNNAVERQEIDPLRLERFQALKEEINDQRRQEETRSRQPTRPRR